MLPSPLSRGIVRGTLTLFPPFGYESIFPLAQADRDWYDKATSRFLVRFSKHHSRIEVPRYKVESSLPRMHSAARFLSSLLFQHLNRELIVDTCTAASNLSLGMT